MNAAQQEPNEQSRDRNASRYLDIGSNIYDVARMARATALMLELYQEQRDDYAKKGFFSGSELVEHTEQWADAVDFMVNHLNEMAQGLRRAYDG